MTATGLDVVIPRGEAEIAEIRRLYWEYREFLTALGPYDAEIVAAIYPTDKYAAVLDRLKDEHCPPRGVMRLALRDGAPVGCGMVQTWAPGTAEIKRVFVSGKARGAGVGLALMRALIADCRDLGFNRILMDTSKPLVAAQHLYERLGFQRRGPYQPVPDIAAGHLIFFEMVLEGPSAPRPDLI